LAEQLKEPSIVRDKAFCEKSIEEIATESIPRISVLGIGGAGCNIASWIKEKGVFGARIYALNSDAMQLSRIAADRKILLGYDVCRGLGCGDSPELGARVAGESSIEIASVLKGSGLSFLIAGLGRGTGTGATPVVATIAKEMQVLTFGVVLIPFLAEGPRLAKAKKGLERLVETCDAVIVVDNNRLRKIAGNLPIIESFGLANNLIASFIRSLSEAISYPSLVNLNFADLKAIATESGVCAMGIGEGSGQTRVEDAVHKALDSQLLDIEDIDKCQAALVNIEGGDDMTLEEFNKAGEMIVSRISPDANVSWGTGVDTSMTGFIRVTLVLAGVGSRFLLEGPASFNTLRQGFSH